MVNIDFDMDGVAGTPSYEPLPAGWYAMRIVMSEQKMTKAGDGKYLQVEFEPDENTHPQIRGRKIWQRYNLWNANTTAVEIAQRDLKALVQACGKSAITDSEELHGIVVSAKVVIRPGNAGYEPTNEIKGYRAIDGGAPVAPAAKSSGSAGSPPWARK